MLQSQIFIRQRKRCVQCDATGFDDAEWTCASGCHLCLRHGLVRRNAISGGRESSSVVVSDSYLRCAPPRFAPSQHPQQHSGATGTFRARSLSHADPSSLLLYESSKGVGHRWATRHWPHG